MMTISELFDELGGAAEVARMIGVSTEHAAAMRRRRSIPARYWVELADKSKKVTLDQLAELAARRHQKPEAA